MSSAGRCYFFSPEKEKKTWIRGEFCRAESRRAGGEQQERHTRAADSSHFEFEYKAGPLGMCALLLLTMQSWHHIWRGSGGSEAAACLSTPTRDAALCTISCSQGRKKTPSNSALLLPLIHDASFWRVELTSPGMDVWLLPTSSIWWVELWLPKWKLQDEVASPALRKMKPNPPDLCTYSTLYLIIIFIDKVRKARGFKL